MRLARTISPRGSTPQTFPIQTSSSGPRAKCGCRISCSGRPPMPNSSSFRFCGPISTTRRSFPLCSSTRRGSVDSARFLNRPSPCRSHEDRRMAVNDEPNRAPAPRRLRLGSDLWPRVGAAVAMGLIALVIAWIGGFVFVAFWWATSVVVLGEWQRIVRCDRLIERVAIGALALALAAVFASNTWVLWAVAALAVGALAVGWLAGPASQIWAGAGALYAGALVVSLGLL